MEGDEIQAKVPALREKFQELYAGSIASEVYHLSDLERLRTEDVYVCCFLHHQHGNVDKAAAMIDSSLKFRKEYEVNDLTENSFSREMHELGACYYHNEDKDGYKILYFCLKKNKKDSQKLPLVKRFVAWWIEKHFLKHPDEKIVVFFDMTDAGVSNLEMDLIKFQISCFTTYYPALLHYMIIFEMHWMLNALWKVIKTILTAEQQKHVIFVKKSEIQKYINKDQLWVHMGGTDTYEYTYIPSEDSGIEMINGEVTPQEEFPPEISMMSTVSMDTSALPTSNKKRVHFAEKDQTAIVEAESLGEDDSSSMKSARSSKSSPKTGSLNIAHRKRNLEEDSFVGPLLTISPAEELEFCITDEGKETLDILSLHNSTADKYIAYKVKTTSPEKYRVRPSTGVVKPKATAEISVYLHPGYNETVPKDKFLVMYKEVESSTSTTQVTDIFKSAARDTFSEHRLRCRLTVSKETPEESAKGESDALDQLVQKMDLLVRSQQSLERRLCHMYAFQLLVIALLVFMGLAVLLSYWLEYLPINRYNVNACLPYHMAGI